jgi:hypothetical protein
MISTLATGALISKTPYKGSCSKFMYRNLKLIASQLTKKCSLPRRVHFIILPGNFFPPQPLLLSHKYWEQEALNLEKEYKFTIRGPSFADPVLFHSGSGVFSV